MPRKTIKQLETAIDHWKQKYSDTQQQLAQAHQMSDDEIRKLQRENTNLRLDIHRIHAAWSQWTLINKGMPEGSPATIQMPREALEELLALLK